MSLSEWRVVTVGREYGSGGAAVGAALAQRIGFRLLDRALIDKIAATAQIDPALAARFDEQVDGWAARVARALRFGGFEGVAAVSGEAILDAERLQALTAAVIEEAAAAGSCVIVGRGAQCLLRRRPETFHLFVYASHEDRARRLRARLGPAADVERLMDEMDRARAVYVRQHFGCDWRDPRLYDLMVDSGLGEAAAVAAIVAALEAASPRRS